ncbi:PIN domain-containing protein [Mesohalobacter salilacus]|uniref:PIN domain-containing protein n=1 Tax=Mesohalobacter salilacus TaxID=2491711 RepID=UPI002682DD95
MIIVVDTNIIFSGVLNPNGRISDLLLNSFQSFDFYAPTFILEELKKHRGKLLQISKLEEHELDFIQGVIIKKVKLIDIENISSKIWEKSLNLVHDVDEFDAPFIALSLQLKSPLWTGDKKLIRGLNKKGFNLVLDTKTISKMR